MNTRLVYILLFLSLAANVFIAGVFIGRGASGGPQSGGPVAELEHRIKQTRVNMRRLVALLPQDERRSVARELRGRRDNLLKLNAERRTLEQQIKTLLTAETVDELALKAALDRHSEIMMVLQGVPKEVLVKVAPKLDRETRQGVAAQLFKRRRRGLSGEGKG